MSGSSQIKSHPIFHLSSHASATCGVVEKLPHHISEEINRGVCSCADTIASFQPQHQQQNQTDIITWRVLMSCCWWCLDAVRYGAMWTARRGKRSKNAHTRWSERMWRMKVGRTPVSVSYIQFMCNLKWITSRLLKHLIDVTI